MEQDHRPLGSVKHSDFPPINCHLDGFPASYLEARCDPNSSAGCVALRKSFVSVHALALSEATHATEMLEG